MLGVEHREMGGLYLDSPNGANCFSPGSATKERSPGIPIVRRLSPVRAASIAPFQGLGFLGDGDPGLRSQAR